MNRVELLHQSGKKYFYLIEDDTHANEVLSDIKSAIEGGTDVNLLVNTIVITIKGADHSGVGIFNGTSTQCNQTAIFG